VKKEIELLQKSFLPGPRLKWSRGRLAHDPGLGPGRTGDVDPWGLLTIFIVFCFLNSWRSTVITGLTLPISVISAFTVMNFMGMTLNVLDSDGPFFSHRALDR